MSTILVLDNDAVLLDLISTVLRLDGHNVIVRNDSIVGLDVCAGGCPPVDLLLTEVDVKPITGFELAKRLRKAGFNSPVLFMSGDTALVGAAGESLGNSAALAKPFTANRLRRAVKTALATKKLTSTKVA